MREALFAELLHTGIRVNVISPGPVTTPLYGKPELDAARLKGLATPIQIQIPLGQFGTPQEIAGPVRQECWPRMKKVQ
jgi:NAD(P)-dependent dehydrogenase (short-subunit alcohol dehydrogenase family)